MLKANDFRTEELFEKYCMLQPNERDSELTAHINLPPLTYSKQYQIKDKSFIKTDDGKNMLSLIEPHFIQSLGEVLTFGAAKYAPGNWKLCEDTSRYKDALLRHIYTYLSGELQDQETGIDHLAHASCNLMFLQYFDNLNKEK